MKGRRIVNTATRQARQRAFDWERYHVAERRAELARRCHVTVDQVEEVDPARLHRETKERAQTEGISALVSLGIPLQTLWALACDAPMTLTVWRVPNIHKGRPKGKPRWFVEHMEFGLVETKYLTIDLDQPKFNLYSPTALYMPPVNLDHEIGLPSRVGPPASRSWQSEVYEGRVEFRSIEPPEPAPELPREWILERMRFAAVTPAAQGWLHFTITSERGDGRYIGFHGLDMDGQIIFSCVWNEDLSDITNVEHANAIGDALEEHARSLLKVWYEQAPVWRDPWWGKAIEEEIDRMYAMP